MLLSHRREKKKVVSPSKKMSKHAAFHTLLLIFGTEEEERIHYLSFSHLYIMSRWTSKTASTYPTSYNHKYRPNVWIRKTCQLNADRLEAVVVKRENQFTALLVSSTLESRWNLFCTKPSRETSQGSAL